MPAFERSEKCVAYELNSHLLSTEFLLSTTDELSSRYLFITRPSLKPDEVLWITLSIIINDEFSKMIRLAVNNRISSSMLASSKFVSLNAVWPFKVVQCNDDRP